MGVHLPLYPLNKLPTVMRAHRQRWEGLGASVCLQTPTRAPISCPPRPPPLPSPASVLTDTQERNRCRRERSRAQTGWCSCGNSPGGNPSHPVQGLLLTT